MEALRAHFNGGSHTFFPPLFLPPGQRSALFWSIPEETPAMRGEHTSDKSLHGNNARYLLLP